MKVENSCTVCNKEIDNTRTSTPGLTCSQKSIQVAGKAESQKEVQILQAQKLQWRRAGKERNGS
jgi:hypothetical protein